MILNIIMVYALCTVAAAMISRDFRHRSCIEKRYLAVVPGDLTRVTEFSRLEGDLRKEYSPAEPDRFDRILYYTQPTTSKLQEKLSYIPSTYGSYTYRPSTNERLCTHIYWNYIHVLLGRQKIVYFLQCWNISAYACYKVARQIYFHLLLQHRHLHRHYHLQHRHHRCRYWIFDCSLAASIRFEPSSRTWVIRLWETLCMGTCTTPAILRQQLG